MRKVPLIGLSLIAGAALLLAATMQEATANRRVAKTYGDRIAPLIGKRFNRSSPRGTMRQHADGYLKLVAVGVDYVEFESEQGIDLYPLGECFFIRLAK